MTRAPRSETEEIQKLAAEYNRRGYKTIVRPRDDEIPRFLQAVEPDLVATSDNDSVVVEVKFKESAVRDPKIAAIAKAVANRPGWRFELVKVAGRIKPPAGPDLPKRPIPLTEARERLEAAEGLLDTQSDLALIAAWTVIEAAVRSALLQADKVPATPQVGALLRQAYSHGLLTWRDLEALLKYMNLRNAVVHGLHAKGTPKAARSLVGLANRLLKDWEAR
jgi:hypothetical protein